jgi:hypothetical protein
MSAFCRNNDEPGVQIPTNIINVIIGLINTRGVINCSEEKINIKIPIIFSNISRERMGCRGWHLIDFKIS